MTAATAIAEQTIVRQAERTAARVVDGRAVVIVIDDRKVHALSEVGTRIWELAEGGRSVGAIADAITTEFEIDRATALRDARGFLAELVALGAIEVGSAAP